MKGLKCSKRMICLLACGALTAGALPPAEVFAAEKADGAVLISSAAEFAEFARGCAVDSYSEGKSFKLTGDIDLTHSGFEPVPYFAGSFDGGGHTITGLRIVSDGSVTGLFRYTAESARIKDLNVTGRVLPGGSGCSVGGIAGENSGEILRCTFDGRAAGIKCVGGIAGVNTETGIITECGFSGDAEGEHRVGGIAGENRGLITSCTNKADINAKEITVTSDSKSYGLTALSNLRDASSVRQDVSELNGKDFLNISDIGGIAGLSSGTVGDCVSSGQVGYERMGYNVGGIAGRTSGRIEGCENSGVVYGRKDAGGIAGQIEPFACWDFSASKTAELQNDLDSLQKQIDSMIDSGEDKTAEARASLAKMNDELKAASAELERIRTQTTGDISAAEKSLNEMRGMIGDYLEETAGSAEELEKQADEAVKEISRIASDTAKSVKNEITGKEKQAKDIITRADQIINAAADDTGLAEYSRMLSELADKLENDPNNAKLAELLELLKSISDDEAQLQLALREQSRLIREELMKGDIEGLIKSLEELKKYWYDPAADGRIDRILELMNELELPKADISAFETYLKGMKDRAAALERDLNELTEVLSQTRELFDTDLKEPDTAKLTKILDGMYDSLDTEREKELIESLKKSAAGMTAGVPDLNGLFGHLKSAGDAASDLADMASSDSGTAEDINTLRNELAGVIDRFSGTVEDVSTVKTKYRSDVSGKGERSLSGTAKNCSNTADVNADTNVGGIVGSMAFEIEFDAEDQLQLSQYIMNDARYLIYTVVDGCVSSGGITAKKECAGGIAGSMDFGSLTGCASYGMIKVQSGDYCGGTAGKSAGTITKCCSRTVLSGGKYVGGIAGSGCDITDCIACSFIDSAKEYSGSAAGFVTGNVSGCRYIENGVGGIDGVSRTGIAEPVSYSDMMKLDVPEEFKKITITFIADVGKTEVIEVPFGGSITKEQLPAVENSGVKYWKWDGFNMENIYYSQVVHGSYADPITTLATEGDIPEFLAEGIFYEDQALTAEQVCEGGGSGWKVSVNGYSEPLKLRFRTDIKDGVLKVNGAEEDYERDGSCIVFTLPNGGSFSYEPAEKSYDGYMIAAVCGGGLCVMILCAVLIAKRSRKKRNKK